MYILLASTTLCSVGLSCSYHLVWWRRMSSMLFFHFGLSCLFMLSGSATEPLARCLAIIGYVYFDCLNHLVWRGTFLLACSYHLVRWRRMSSMWFCHSCYCQYSCSFSIMYLVYVFFLLLVISAMYLISIVYFS